MVIESDLDRSGFTLSALASAPTQGVMMMMARDL